MSHGLDPERLARILTEAYPIGGARCKLEYSFVNDIYLVVTPAERHVLKVYRRNRRSPGEIAWEGDLVQHLKVRGAPVAGVLARRDGGVVTRLDMGEESCYALMFAYAPGAKPVTPFTTDLYHQVGRAAGLFHAAAEDFTSPHPRSSMGLLALMDEPLKAMRPTLMQMGNGHWEYASKLAVRLRAALTDLASQGLDWGVCHQDLTLDNVHVDTDGTVTIFDLDSAAPGWRALEPQGAYHAALSQGNDHWDAYLAGYGEVRPLHAIDVAAIPYFVLAYAFGELAWVLGKTSGSTAVNRDGELWNQRNEVEKAIGISGWWRQWEADHLAW